MDHSSRTVKKDNRPLQQLVQNFVLPALRRRRPQRLLLVSNDLPGLGCLPDLAGLAGNGFVALRAGKQDAGNVVSCDSAELPFQDGSFEVVVMHHVFTDGSEPELNEARRILAGGGDVFVLGAGSVRNRFGTAGRDLPGLQVRPLVRRLQENSFSIEQCVGIGLMGVPVTCQRSWQQAALPFADHVLIRGRHRSIRPTVTPLRFSRARAAGVQPAAMDSLSREAV